MKIAVLQSLPTPGAAAPALERLDAAAAEAARAGAALLVTPEMFLSGYVLGAAAMRAAAEGAGALWTGAGAIAARHGVAILAGGPVAASGGGVLNAARLFDAAGALRTDYAKTHLYGTLDRDQFVAGDRLAPPVEIAGRRIGIAICYDIEFPETARSLALAGAEVIAVPTANMEPYASVCTRLVPARAEENTVPIAYANYVGREGGLTYCGRSVIAGADGEDLARADATTPGLIVADPTAEATAAARTRTPYLEDRRPGLYRLSGQDGPDA